MGVAATCWFCGSGVLRKSLCLHAIGFILNRVLARGRSGWLCSRVPFVHISQLFSLRDFGLPAVDFWALHSVLFTLLVDIMDMRLTCSWKCA